MTFSHYLALGDSMSIDLYPALDAGATDVAVALERVPTAGAIAPLGAASLFFENDEARWPEETGNDLTTHYPGIAIQALASDGATIGDVFGDQLLNVIPSDDPTVITLTVGSEDLFSAFSAKPRKALLEQIVADLGRAYTILVETIKATRPRSLLILTTLCDPSDRVGHIPGILEDVGPLPLPALDAFNDHIRTVAAATPRTVLAEAYLHFLGHGASVEEEHRWYWRRSPLEPNAEGANQLRGLWVDAVRQVTEE